MSRAQHGVSKLPKRGLGAAAQSLAPKLVGLHALMQAQVAKGMFPGAVWLVAHGDEVVVDLVGTQAIAGTAPMRRDTIFRIASMTKAITAACVMMLIEEGRLE